MLPKRIGGNDVQLYGSTTWIRWLCNGRFPDGVKEHELLGSDDPESITVAWGRVGPLGTDMTPLLAVRVPGQEAKLTVENMAASERETKSPPPTMTWELVGGKEVFVVSDPLPYFYAYPLGDVVFMVTGPVDPAQAAEIIAALP